MQWIRNHRREFLAGAVIMVGLAMIAVAMLLMPASDSSTSSSAGPRGSRHFEAPAPLPTAANSTGKSDLGSPKTVGNNPFFAGLAGEGGERHLPRHHITVQLSSRAPIGNVGYLIPTSLDAYYGVVKGVGTHWSLSTTVYGRPDYAQLFARAGARGEPVSCTITVDGRVTDARSTEGPYGQLFCQG